MKLVKRRKSYRGICGHDDGDEVKRKTVMIVEKEVWTALFVDLMSSGLMITVGGVE